MLHWFNTFACSACLPACMPPVCLSVCLPALLFAIRLVCLYACLFCLALITLRAPLKICLCFENRWVADNIDQFIK